MTKREAGTDQTRTINAALLKIHQLAIDPRNRQLIAEDMECVQTVVLALDTTADVDTVYKSMETLSYLISHSTTLRNTLSQNTKLKIRLCQVPFFSLCLRQKLYLCISQIINLFDQFDEVKHLAIHVINSMRRNKENAQQNRQQCQLADAIQSSPLLSCKSPSINAAVQ